jgi:hypothetical protein
MSLCCYSSDEGFLTLDDLLLELMTLALDIGKSELGPGLREFGLVTCRESYLPGLVACGESEFDRVYSLCSGSTNESLFILARINKSYYEMTLRNGDYESDKITN